MSKPVVIRASTHPRYSFVVFHPAAVHGQPRQRSYFNTRKEAQAFAAAREIEVKNHGTRHGAVSDAERAALVHFRTWAAQWGTDAPDLAEIVNAGILAWEKGRSRRLTVSAMCDARLDLIQRLKLSARHIIDTQSRLRRFTAKFGPRLAATLTPDEIERWLLGLGQAPQSLVNFRRVVGGAFSLAVKRGELDSNPVAKVDAVKVKRGAVAILTVPEMTGLLLAAPPEIRPLFVLQAFCGCRRAEAERMTWSNIHLTAQTPYVELDAAITKTGSPRNVILQPNAVAWLKLDRMPGDAPLGISEWQYRHQGGKARAAAGIASWDENLLRHSYGSYRLASTQNAALVSEEMGNSPAVLKRHYARPLDPATVAAYWRILPAGEPVNVVPMKKGKRA